MYSVSDIYFSHCTAKSYTWVEYQNSSEQSNFSVIESQQVENICKLELLFEEVSKNDSSASVLSALCVQTWFNATTT